MKNRIELLEFIEDKYEKSHLKDSFLKIMCRRNYFKKFSDSLQWYELFSFQNIENLKISVFGY